MKNIGVGQKKLIGRALNTTWRQSGFEG